MADRPIISGESEAEGVGDEFSKWDIRHSFRSYELSFP